MEPSNTYSTSSDRPFNDRNRTPNVFEETGGMPNRPSTSSFSFGGGGNDGNGGNNSGPTMGNDDPRDTISESIMECITGYNIYDDIFDSSCDEIEIQETKRLAKRCVISQDPPLITTPGSTQNGVNAPNTSTELTRCILPPAGVVSNPTININKNFIRIQHEKFKTKLRQNTNNAGIMDPDNKFYSPKNCFGCIWEKIQPVDVPEVIAAFLEHFQTTFGRHGDLDNMISDCITEHRIFKAAVYPLLNDKQRIVWRSWQMLYHLCNHTRNANVVHYYQTGLAKTNVINIYNSCYGPNSKFANSGVVDTSQSINLMRAQNHLIKIYQVDPINFMYNSPKTKYDVRTNSALINPQDSVLQIASQYNKKLPINKKRPSNRSSLLRKQKKATATGASSFSSGDSTPIPHPPHKKSKSNDDSFFTEEDTGNEPSTSTSKHGGGNINLVDD